MSPEPIRCPLARHATDQPDSIALVIRQPQGSAVLHSYRQLHNQVEQRRNWLQQQGIRPGQHLLVRLEDPTEIIRLLIAALRLGCVLIPINPAFPSAQQLELLDRCDADGWITAPTAGKPPLSGALDRQSCRWLELPELDDLCRIKAPDFTIQNPNAPLSGVLTSGSTGQPKLALHSFNNHHASAQGSRSLIPLQPGDGWAMTLPLHHISGQAIVFRTLLAGASLIIPAPNEPLSQLLLEPHLTHLSAVTTQLLRLQQNLFDFQHSRLRHLLLGGSAIPASLLGWLEPQSPQCWISYGLTEMSSQVMTGPLSLSGQLAQRLPHCQLQLTDDHEILVKGDSLFLGYYRNGDYHCPVDADGWFHTRDLGRLDAQQHLSITGRRDNQFISGGENIQPELIERTLSSYPGVDVCYVVPVDDDCYGQRPVAFISPHAGIDTAALRLWLSQRLPSYLIPASYLSLPESPTTLKPSRLELMRIAAQQLSLKPDTR